MKNVHRTSDAECLIFNNDESDGKLYPSDAKCREGVVVDSLNMSSGDHDKFEEEKFMKILVNLKDTQESIQGFSGWCIKNRKAAYKMARCWIKVIKKVSLCLLMIISVLTSNIRLQVRIEQKLVLFYLVNDIVQHSAKRNYGELLDKFRSGIKEAMPHLKVNEIEIIRSALFHFRRRRLDQRFSAASTSGRRERSLTRISFR